LPTFRDNLRISYSVFKHYKKRFALSDRTDRLSRNLQEFVCSIFKFQHIQELLHYWRWDTESLTKRR